MSVKNMSWKLLTKLSSLRFSISLLLLLASISVLGTVIEQDQSLTYYQLNYSDSKPVLFWITWRVIMALSLNHVYSSVYFLTVLFLFFLSLLFCTFSTQLPILKHARQWSFLYTRSSLEKKMCYNQYSSASLLILVYILNLDNYYVFHKGCALYSYKGLLGRIAPIFVHLSIVLTLIGSLFGSIGGFIAQEIIPCGEIFHVQNTIRFGRYSVVPYNFLGRINDFFILFNHDHSIQQFYSNISLLSHKGRTLFNKSISVNSPLRVRGVTLYQTDWELNALRVKVGTNNLLTKVLQKSSTNSTRDTMRISRLVIDSEHTVFILIPDLENHVLIYDNLGNLLVQTEYGLWNVFYGVPVVIKDIVSSTGIQIKVDPGLYIAYSGFLVLMISVTASYISYSQIWVNQDVQGINFSGSTNRAFLSFEDEIFQLYLKCKALSRFLD